MPLIQIFGQPGTGKSKFAADIYNYCQVNNIDALVVSPSTFSMTEEETIWKAGEFRKRLHQIVNQTLSSQRLLIIDYTSHLKSFRYEMFCIAREKQTTNCIISTFTPDLQYQQGKMSVSEKAFQDVSSRFEDLIIDSDWDSPLFGKQDNIIDIVDSLFSKNKKVFQAKSTAYRRARQIPLHELVQQIITRIYQQQGVLGERCNIQFFDAVYFATKRLYSLKELKQLQEQFIRSDTKKLEKLDNVEQAQLLVQLFEAVQ